MGGQNCGVVVDVDTRILFKIVGIRNRIITVGLNEKDALRLGGPKRSGDPTTGSALVLRALPISPPVCTA